MKKITLMFFILAIPFLTKAQEVEKKFGIKFSGFVKNDAFFDTRETVTGREGHFLFYPKAENLDANDDDINANPSFNMLAVQSRLSGTISGPNAFGAKTSGKIEGDFFAQANDNINLFRLRHAFVKLAWTNTELLVGQYWNPMFVTSCFPGTVSFNTGVPFQPFARNPQIRLTQKFGSLKAIVAAQSQRDYTSYGGSTSLRNSSIPDMHLQLHFGNKSESGTEIAAGAGISYKTLKPRIVTDSLISTDATVSGLSALGFLKIKTPAVTVKCEAIYGENIFDVLSLGGYAVSKIDAVTDEYEYTTLNVVSSWFDIQTNRPEFNFGLFIGYTKNLGSKDEIVGDVFGRGGNIAYAYRVAPRAVFNSGKVRFALEFEYTTAAYGTPDNKGVVQDEEAISNLRTLMSVYYFF